MYGIFKAKSKGKSGQQLELGDIAILKCCTWINLSRSREREGEGEGVEYLGSEDARDVALQGKPKPHTTSDKLKAQISLQQADGNLQFNSTLASVLTIPP